MADSMGMAVMAKMLSGLAAKNAPRTTKNVELIMEEEGERWKPSNAEDLLSALVGGLDQLGQ